LEDLNESSKKALISEIELDFKNAYNGIIKLPEEAKFGVFVAYRYYKQLLKKIAKTPAEDIKNTRIRVADYKKMELLTRSYVKYQLNLL
jgi:phytoene/squalene synthetase